MLLQSLYLYHLVPFSSVDGVVLLANVEAQAWFIGIGIVSLEDATSIFHESKTPKTIPILFGNF